MSCHMCGKCGISTYCNELEDHVDGWAPETDVPQRRARRLRVILEVLKLLGLANFKLEWNIPSFNVYKSVNGQSLSTTSKKQAEALERLIRTSVKHTLSGTLTKYNYSSFNIQHRATSGGPLCSIST